MLIAQISDCHIHTAGDNPQARLDDLARTIQSINALDPAPTLVVHTGDIAQEASAADYSAASQVLSQLSAPLYATVGNRDRRGPLRDVFMREDMIDPDPEFMQYAVDAGGYRLVAADTLDAHSNLGDFCAGRERSLRRLLGGADKPTLVFLHHPPVELEGIPGQPLQFRDPESAATLASCIAETRQLVGIIAGHVHRAKDVAFGNVRLTTVPAIATDLTREKDADGAYIRRPIYHLHELAPGGVTTTRVVL